MKKLVNMEITAFLDELSSRNHMPGGGSVAALTGALGAALSSMVCNFPSEKQNNTQKEQKVKELLQQSETARTYLSELIDEDSQAFDRVLKAYKMPQETTTQSDRRKEEIQQSLIKAACVPLDVARTCKKILNITLKLSEKGNKNLISDVAVAAQLAFAGIETACYNVKINLRLIKDKEFVKKTEEEIKNLRLDANHVLEAVVTTVDEALDAGK